MPCEAMTQLRHVWDGALVKTAAYFDVALNLLILPVTSSDCQGLTE